MDGVMLILILRLSCCIILGIIISKQTDKENKKDIDKQIK